LHLEVVDALRTMSYVSEASKGRHEILDCSLGHGALFHAIISANTSFAIPERAGLAPKLCKPALTMGQFGATLPRAGVT